MTDVSQAVLREAVAVSVQAARDAAAEESPLVRPGIVQSIDPTNTIAMVQADGPMADDFDGSFGAAVAAPVTLRPGDRVLLLFAGTAPGCFVIGRRSGDYDDWHVVGEDGEPVFVSGWGHSAGTNQPGANAPARVMFTLRSGRVELRGRATRTSGASQNVFVLPEEYWPDNDLLLAAQGALGAHVNVGVDQATGTVSVSTGGEVVFDGISYLARVQAPG